MHHTHNNRARKQGYILVLVLVFLGIFLTAATAYVHFITLSARSARTTTAQAQALAIAEAGMTKAVYQLNQNASYAGETNTLFGEGAFTVSVAVVDSVTKRVTATGYVPNATNPTAKRIIKANISINDDVVSFHYGVQAGEGGFSLENSSSITGNVYASGPITGTSQNYIYGDVVSAGPSGLVYGIHATSSVYAHTIGKASDATLIDKDSYYALSQVNTTVSGTSHPNSPDLATTSLPISDEQIGDWEAVAAGGGTATCSGSSYDISSGNVSLGPIKIPCDLNISGTSVVTLLGHIWVTGNITIQNSAIVKISPSFGSENIAIIADNPSNRLTSSQIIVKNTASFQNSGAPGSFILLVSQNNSAEKNGSVNAIDLNNSSSAMIAYAAHGLIPLANTVSLREVTAYKIALKNSANVRYDTGLISTVFDSGPGGSWSFVPGTYAIVQ